MIPEIPYIRASAIGGYVEYQERCDALLKRLDALHASASSKAREHVLANLAILYERFRYGEPLFDFADPVLMKSDFGHKEEFIAAHHFKTVLSSKGFALVSISSLKALTEYLLDSASNDSQPAVFMLEREGDGEALIGEYGQLGIPGNPTSRALFLPDLLIYQPVQMNSQTVHQVSVIDFKMSGFCTASETKHEYLFQQSIYASVLDRAISGALEYDPMSSVDRSDFRIDSFLIYLRRDTSMELKAALTNYQANQPNGLMASIDNLVVNITPMFAAGQYAGSAKQDYSHDGIRARIHRLLRLTYAEPDERVANVNEASITCTHMQKTLATLRNDGSQVPVDEHGINKTMFSGGDGSPYFNCQKCLRHCCPVRSFRKANNGHGLFDDFLAYLNQTKTNFALSGDIQQCLAAMVKGIPDQPIPLAEQEVAAERLQVQIPSAGKADFTYLCQLSSGAAHKQQIEKVAYHYQPGLVPLQQIFYDQVIHDARYKRLKRVYLISSGTNTGKMDCALMLANQRLIDCEKEGRRGRVLILQPKKQLANFTEEQVQEYFSEKTKLCSQKGPFYKNHDLFGVDVRAKKPIKASVFHGSSIGRIKQTLERCDVVVSTYEYMIEFLLSQDIDQFDCIIFDEIHSRLRLDDEEMGASMLTSMLNYTFVMQIIKTQNDPYVAMMSGTLPAQWTSTMANNPHINLIESSFSHSRIQKVAMEMDDPAIAADVTRLVTFREGYFHLNADLLNQPVQGASRFRSRVLPIFVYSKREIDRIGTAFESLNNSLAITNEGRKPFTVLKYNTDKTTQSKDTVERMIKDSNDNPDGCTPIVLITTNAIAEGVKLPSNLAFVVYSQDPEGNQFYDSDTIRQMSNRIARGFTPERKIPGLVVTLKVNTKRIRERQDNYHRLCLNSCLLDKRDQDGLTVQEGLDLVARTTGYYNLMNPTRIANAIEILRDRHYVEENGLITPSGRMVVKYESWMPLPDFEPRSVEANILINTVIMPYLSNDEFMADFLGEKAKGALNYFDPSYSELFKLLVKEATPDDSTCERIFNHVFAEHYGAADKHAIRSWLDNLQRPWVIDALMKTMLRFPSTKRPNEAHIISLVKMTLWKTIFIKMIRDKSRATRSFLQTPFYDTNARFDNKERLIYNYAHFLELTAKAGNHIAARDNALEPDSKKHVALITDESLAAAQKHAEAFIGTIYPLYLDSQRFQRGWDYMRIKAASVHELISPH